MKHCHIHCHMNKLNSEPSELHKNGHRPLNVRMQLLQISSTCECFISTLSKQKRELNKMIIYNIYQKKHFSPQTGQK